MAKKQLATDPLNVVGWRISHMGSAKKVINAGDQELTSKQQFVKRGINRGNDSRNQCCTVGHHAYSSHHNGFLMAANWMANIIRRGRQSAEEIEKLSAEHRDRLLNAMPDELKLFLGGKLPLSILRSYANRTLLVHGRAEPRYTVGGTPESWLQENFPGENLRLKM